MLELSLISCFVFCFYFTLLFSEKKDQFLQVTRHVNLTSLPVQMASVSRILGDVILTMTVVMTLMKPIVVSVVYFICVVWLSLTSMNSYSVFHTQVVQYRSKVSWQSLDTRYSILDSFEYQVSSLEERVSSIELWVEKVNELVAWLISWEINCTNGPQTKYVYMQTTSLASNHSAHFAIRKQIITKACDRFDCKHR